MTDINHGRTHRVADASLVRASADAVEMRISDADRNGTLLGLVTRALVRTRTQVGPRAHVDPRLRPVCRRCLR